MLFNRKGQNTAEYAIVIALVVAAAIAMRVYVKRSLQGGIKYTVDHLQKDASGTKQYEPYYSQSDYSTTQQAYKDSEETKTGGEVVRTFGAGGAKTTTRTGEQKVLDTTYAD